MGPSELLLFANWSTLLVCMVLKFPQILALVSSGSARGISLKSLLLELAGSRPEHLLPLLQVCAECEEPGMRRGHRGDLHLLNKWGVENASFPNLGGISLPQPKLMGLSFGHLDKQKFVAFLRYQKYYDYPIETYLEYPILVAQDVVLLLLIFYYNTSVKEALPYLAVFVAGWYILALQKWIIDLAMTCCTFISAFSKFAQLQCLWKTKDSGQVSALTWGMASYTCGTRIFTTLMTTNDTMVLFRFITMMLLNIWVTITILHYRRPAKKTD